MLINHKGKVAFDFIDNSVRRPDGYEDRVRIADLERLTLDGIYKQVGKHYYSTALTSTYYAYKQELSKVEGNLVGYSTWQDMRGAILVDVFFPTRIRAGLDALRATLCL